MKSVGMPVSNPGASKPRFLTSSRPGVPIGWTVSDSPSGDHQALLVAEPRGHRGRDEEQDQPEVGEQRRHLRVLVAIAVDVHGAVVGADLADPEAAAAHDAGQRPPPRRRSSPHGPAAAGRRTARAGRPGRRPTPRHSRGVRSSVHTMIEVDEHDEGQAEPRSTRTP